MSRWVCGRVGENLKILKIFNKFLKKFKKIFFCIIRQLLIKSSTPENKDFYYKHKVLGNKQA